MTLNVTMLPHTRRQAARTRMTDNRRDYGRRTPNLLGGTRQIGVPLTDQTFWRTRRVIGQRGGTPCRSH